MEYLLIGLSIVISALVTHYLFKNFNIFKKHDVIHIPPVPILGNMSSFIFRQTSFVEFTQTLYNFNQEAKYIGLYAMTKPILLLRDPELIKAVLIKNFDTFNDRPTVVNFNDYVISKSLFALQNKKWRDIRNLLRPFFSPSKIKIIFTSMSKYAVDFAELMSTLPVDKSDVNMKDIFDRYTNDVIALCNYGLEINSVRDPTNKFYTSGKDITHMSVIRSMKFIFIRAFPKLGRILNIKLLNNQAMKYFEANIKNIITTRNTEQITRPDIIQLMIDNNNKPNRIQLDMDDMIAQAYVLYFAGFETTSSVMSFIVHKIVENPSIQIKLRQEIDKVLEESNGNLITYEIINQMEYLHAVIKEALRLFSPSILERVCNRAFEFPPALPGKKPFIVEEGMTIWIPPYAIHHDKKYYDNPEEFRPERFLNNTHDTSVFFPFGLGPKMCIGNRVGILMIKIVLFHLLERCELKQCTKTKSLKFSKKHLLMMMEDGFWINVQRRNDMQSALKIAT